MGKKEEDKDKNEDSFSSRNILPFDIDDFKEDHLESYSCDDACVFWVTIG